MIRTLTLERLAPWVILLMVLVVKWCRKALLLKEIQVCIYLLFIQLIILVPTVDFDGSTTSDLEKTKATSYTNQGYTNQGKGKQNVPASRGDPGMHLFAFKSHSQHYT